MTRAWNSEMTEDESERGLPVRSGSQPGSTGLSSLPEALAKVAPSEVTITLQGETGTGKDRLARTIHARSRRANGPFVVLDCGALVASLAESELFGHERGAFTGAVSARPGAFERAQGGTLFLDEIGELPLDLQPRLLRSLEQRQVQRVGGAEMRSIDVRVIAATNRDLRREVEAGRFRADLYFRLAALVYEVPPLRSRLGELPGLVQDILWELGRGDLSVEPEVYRLLRERPWIGNVRELKNVLRLALAFLEGSDDILKAGHLHLSPVVQGEVLDRLALGGVALEALERVAIRQTLAQCDGNRVRTAEALGIAVSTLYEKLKKYGLY